MLATAWAAIGLGGIGARKGRIAGHAQAGGGKCCLDQIDQIAARSGPVAVAQHDIRACARARCGFDGLMRHGMAVNQQGLSGLQARLGHKGSQLVMVGVPDLHQPRGGVRAFQLAAIDGPAIGHDTRDHAKARGHARIDGTFADPFDQGRVQLIGAAVQIDIGARIGGGQKWCTQLGGRCKQLIYKGIF